MSKYAPSFTEIWHSLHNENQLSVSYSQQVNPTIQLLAFHVYRANFHISPRKVLVSEKVTKCTTCLIHHACDLYPYNNIYQYLSLRLTHGWTIFILVIQLSLTWKCPVLRSYFKSPLRSKCKAAVWIKSALYCSNRGSSLRRSCDSPYRVGARNNL